MHDGLIVRKTCWSTAAHTSYQTRKVCVGHLRGWIMCCPGSAALDETQAHATWAAADASARFCRHGLSYITLIIHKQYRYMACCCSPMELGHITVCRGMVTAQPLNGTTACSRHHGYTTGHRQLGDRSESSIAKHRLFLA